MDPLVHSPFPFPSTDKPMLPFHLWTAHAAWPFLDLENWERSPWIVGVA